MMKVRTAVESQAIVRSRDKLRSMQILSRAGVGMPKTAFTNYSEDVPAMINQVGGAPVIIKLLEGTQGLGVVLAESAKAAQSVIEAFHNLKARIIVQEFIAESKGADLRAFVVDGAGGGRHEAPGQRRRVSLQPAPRRQRHPRKAEPRRKSRCAARHQSPGPGHCRGRHAAKQARSAGAGSKLFARPRRHRESHQAQYRRPHHRVHHALAAKKKGKPKAKKDPEPVDAQSDLPGEK
jgi:ribosomal protein S6--L-glutamate ligase